MKLEKIIGEFPIETEQSLNKLLKEFNGNFEKVLRTSSSK